MDRERKSLSEYEKRKLGFIIREVRKLLYENAKIEQTIANNPYTKENFCENNKICHYNTLTKLEKDYISDDRVYYVLLSKLGLTYDTTYDEHLHHMEILDRIQQNIFKVFEYMNESLMDELILKLNNLQINQDCITYQYAQLFFNIEKFLYLKDVKEEEINRLKVFIAFYEGLYKALAYHCLGLYYLKLYKFDDTLYYFDKAKEIYQKNGISMGVINHHYISLYNLKKDYQLLYKTSKKMEKYYIKTKNFKRLYSVYDNLIIYYNQHLAFEYTEKYFNKSLELIEKNKELERFEFATHFNFALVCYSNYKNDLAIKHYKKAYDLCKYDQYKLRIINMLLINYTLLKYEENGIIPLIEEGQNYIEKGIESEQFIFKYFKYKYDQSSYYRRYVNEQLIPYLKTNPGHITTLLFIYQDFYEIKG